MKRTDWAVTAALVIAACSLAVAGARRYSLGEDIDGPRGRGAWKVAQVTTGQFTQRDGSLTMHLPPSFRRQQLVDAQPQAVGVVSRRGPRTPGGKGEVVWDPAAVAPGKPQSFRLSYSMRCVLGVRRPTTAMAEATRRLDAAPSRGEHLAPSARIQSDAEPIRRKAEELAEEGGGADADLARRLFEYVRDLPDEPEPEPLGALECLEQGRGNSGGKSRLLVALCRNRGLPARLVSGLRLGAERDQGMHHWAEVWVGHWLPADPSYGHFGTRQLPANYFVLHLGDEDVVQVRGGSASTGSSVRRLALSSADEPPSAVKAFWMRLSLFNLRPAEKHLARFLLLLPLAAIIVCVFRTVIGVPTFGTFTPALLGLAFLDLRALPWGMAIFAAIVVAGWLLRRLLQRFHLLQVPRVAALLTLLVVLLLASILAASHAGVATTRYISLFPLIILTHLVERFWVVEAEDGARASFKTLLYTLGIAATVSLALAHPAVADWMFRYPETLGLVLAAQLVLGRYTGYRLTELFRFADLAAEQGPAQPPARPAERPREAAVPGGPR